jgi:Protein of Unknown function (DUF2784)
LVRLGVAGLDSYALSPSSANAPHASLIYAIVIEIVPWPPCPLTATETWLEVREGIEPAHGPFLVQILDAVVYPDLPEWFVVGCAVLVCAAMLCVYMRRYLRRTGSGQW